jgi:hypothetical protein
MIIGAFWLEFDRRATRSRTFSMPVRMRPAATRALGSYIPYTDHYARGDAVRAPVRTRPQGFGKVPVRAPHARRFWEEPCRQIPFVSGAGGKLTLSDPGLTASAGPHPPFPRARAGFGRSPPSRPQPPVSCGHRSSRISHRRLPGKCPERRPEPVLKTVDNAPPSGSRLTIIRAFCKARITLLLPTDCGRDSLETSASRSRARPCQEAKIHAR